MTADADLEGEVAEAGLEGEVADADLDEEVVGAYLVADVARCMSELLHNSGLLALESA